MPLAGEPGVEEVLRARSNARRIKEHYEGTLGVPSELQSLSHLLTHDKEAVYAGLENLPFYNKSNILPPPLPTAEPDHDQRDERARRKGPTEPCVPPPEPCKASCSLSAGGVLTPSQEQAALRQQAARQAAAEAPFPPASLWPLAPELETLATSGRISAPQDLNPDPWFCTGEQLREGQVTVASAPEQLPNPNPQQQPRQPNEWGQEVELGRADQQPPLHLVAQALFSGEGPSQMPGPPHSNEGPHQDQDGALWQPRSPSAVSPPSHGSPSRAGEGFGSWGPLAAAAQRARSGSDFGSGLDPDADETAEKHLLARQRLLSARDLSPQEWARIGPPQDAVDHEKFTAREYNVTVDYDRFTLLPKRVARPDIFHISSEEARRRQAEADEATLALQAQRRAEADAAERAAEEEHLARTAYRGPRYDALGVLQAERTASSPARPRYLDWHPGGLGGVTQSSGEHPQGQQGQRQPRQSSSQLLRQSRRSASGLTGGCDTTGCSSTPAGVSRVVSTMRSRAGSATALAYGSRPMRGSSLGVPGQAARRISRGCGDLGADGYVYEDLGEDMPQDEQALGYGSPAYDTRPPQRRHHSALAGQCTFAPPQRPAGVSDAHYAQMVRQQRKWLNAPAQPPRPLSAAPMPAPLSYARPRSSRPPPEGTAAPIPSRAAGEAEALASATEAANLSTADLRTIIQPHNPLQRLPTRGRITALWANSRPLSALTPGFSRSSSVQQQRLQQQQSRRRDGADDGASTTAPTSRPSTAAAPPLPPKRGKRLPWEAREHAAAAVAATIIPGRISVEGEDAAPGPGQGVYGAMRRSLNGVGSISVAAGGGGRSRPMSSASKRQLMAQAPPQRKAGVFGETVPPPAAAAGGEQYTPRKFEMHDGMVLDGYMARLP